MAKVFYKSMSVDQGRGSIDLRVVLGALLVKHIEGISDEDTIQYIQENVYAQYFVGLPKFQAVPVFSATLFVEIRKRLGESGARQLNDVVLKQAQRLRAIKHRAKPRKKSSKGKEGGDGGPEAEPENEAVQNEQPAEEVRNKGKLKVDATVVPQHIGYPTDTRLLHCLPRRIAGRPGCIAKS